MRAEQILQPPYEIEITVAPMLQRGYVEITIDGYNYRIETREAKEFIAQLQKKIEESESNMLII